MEIKVIEAGEVYTHLALVGKLDIAGVGAIENKFIGYTVSRRKSAVLDFSAVTFMGSMGLRLLLGAAKPLSLDKKKIVILGPQPIVKEMLDASGIGDVIEITDDPDIAVALAQL